MNSEVIAPQSATIGSNIVREHSQFLIFSVNYEEYGVDIMTVREIRGWSDATRLPNTPEYVRGVMNLRGVIVPIFDLRARFTGILTEMTPKHVLIVLMAGERMVSILADTVSDIITANSEDMKCAPDMVTTVEQRYITGLIAVDQRMIVVLNMEKLLGKPLSPKP
ncbi:MAG: purine-binding chemotaxis protein CheW [Alphaproteobacteria bacterium]|nr:MAG: purine-binding chemotaxis protein CheW [Alphaproteobacteria bacterium]